MTVAPAETIRTLLSQINCEDALEQHVDYRRITHRCDLTDLEAYLKRHGWKIERRNSNVYGWIKIVPIVSEAPTPVLRIVTRSDVAAVYGRAS